MNARTLAVLSVLAAPIAVMGTGRVWAQVPTSPGGSIPPQVIETTFPFLAGGKTLPAGKYVIEQPTRERVVFRSAAGSAFGAPVITRLAQPLAPLVDPQVSFDKVGDKYYVSEVWIPGWDGFLLGSTMELHTHLTLKATAKQ